MMHQYHPQRGRTVIPFGRIGSVNIGDTFYIQDGMTPFRLTHSKASIIRRNPWQVVAWLNREYHPAVKGRATTYMAGGHLAIVRSLRDGRTQTVADWMLTMCDDADLGRDYLRKNRSWRKAE